MCGGADAVENSDVPEFVDTPLAKRVLRSLSEFVLLEEKIDISDDALIVRRRAEEPFLLPFLPPCTASWYDVSVSKILAKDGLMVGSGCQHSLSRYCSRGSHFFSMGGLSPRLVMKATVVPIVVGHGAWPLRML